MYVVARFEQRACVAVAVALHQCERGAPCERGRAYFGILAKIDKAYTGGEVKQHIHAVLNGSKLPPEKRIPALDCLVLDEDKRRAFARSRGFDMGGPRLTQ